MRPTIAWICCAVSFTLVACGQDWELFREDTATSAPRPELLWEAHTDSHDYPVMVSSTMANGVVYAASYSGHVFALDAHTGAVVWEFITPGDPSPPVIVGEGVVHVFDRDTHHALDAHTGELLWRRHDTARSGVYTPELHNGVLFTLLRGADNNSTVEAVDERTGRQLWEAEVRQSSFPLFFPLASDGEYLYVSDDLKVHALDSTTGELVWSIPIPGNSPTTVGSSVFMVSVNDPHRLDISTNDLVNNCPLSEEAAWCAHAVDRSTGRLIWSYEPQITGTWAYLSAPVIADGIWYLPADELTAIDTTTGHAIWSAPIYVLGSPLVADGKVVVKALEGSVHVLDAATGDEIWSIDIAHGTDKVVLADGVLYVHGVDALLHAIDVETGDRIWTVEASFVGGDHRVYAVSDSAVYVSNDGIGIQAFWITLRA